MPRIPKITYIAETRHDEMYYVEVIQESLFIYYNMDMTRAYGTTRYIASILGDKLTNVELKRNKKYNKKQTKRDII